jgi:membrane protein
MGAALPGYVVLGQALNVIVSLAVVTVLFAMMYKTLPDVKLQWRDVWAGAIVTAGLFTVGKFLIGLYLGRSTTASSYGAAGSVVVLLLWIYYSSQVILLGAEFTRAWVEGTRGQPQPEAFAAKSPGAKVLPA